MTSVFWQVAARNLWRNPRRSLLALAAVALGYLGISLFADYVVWAETQMTTMSVYLHHNGHINLIKKESLDKYFTKPNAYLISAAEQEKIAAILAGDNRVEYLGKSLRGMGMINTDESSAPFMAIGVDTDLEYKLRHEPDVLRWMKDVLKATRGELKAAHPGIAPVGLTPALAQKLGRKGLALDGHGTSQQVQLLATAFGGGISVIDGDIVQEFSTGLVLADETAVVTSLDALQKLYNTDGVSAVSVYLHDRSDLSAVLAELQTKLKDQRVDVEALSYQTESLSPFYVSVTSFIYAAAILFLLLISGVVLLSLASTMSMSVIERSREIGSLRAMGFHSRTVNGLFIREGLLLSLAGVLVGFIANHIVSIIVNGTGLYFDPPGIAGSNQFLVIPNATVSGILAIIFLVLGGTAIAWIVNKRSQLNIVSLLSNNNG